MNTNFSKRLKQAMKAQGYKQVDVIEKSKKYSEETGIKISKTDLSQYVNGKVNPGQKKLYMLAKVLNVSEAWLLGYDIPKERISDEQRNEINNNDTIAAHFDKEELTEEEQKEVQDFINFLKSKRK